jgi:hypothetical protein
MCIEYDALHVAVTEHRCSGYAIARIRVPTIKGVVITGRCGGASLWARLIPAAEHIRSAAVACVDRFGFVQNVCGAPTFDRPGMAPEGQAFFILMEAAASHSQ